MSRPRNSSNIMLIAKEAGVSKSTVSRVMNNRSEVGEEARRRVQKVLKSKAFVAAPISTRKLNVGVVLPLSATNAWESVMDIYYDLSLSGMAQELGENGIDLTLIFHYIEEGSSIVDKLRARACQAAIIVNSNKLLASAEDLSDSGIPVMILNGEWKKPHIGAVDCDCFGAGLQLGRHLAGLGRRNVSAILNIQMKNHSDRLAGLRKGLAEKFGEEGFKLFEIPFIQKPFVFESGFAQTEKALAEHPETDAIVGINDQVAYGSIRACAKAGLRIPQDVAIAGFDDYPMSRMSNPPLTTVRQPIFEMGRIAARHALEAIRKPWTSEPPTIVMKTELIVRESTKGA